MEITVFYTWNRKRWNEMCILSKYELKIKKVATLQTMRKNKSLYRYYITLFLNSKLVKKHSSQFVTCSSGLSTFYSAALDHNTNVPLMVESVTFCSDQQKDITFWICHDDNSDFLENWIETTTRGRDRGKRYQPKRKRLLRVYSLIRNGLFLNLVRFDLI